MNFSYPFIMRPVGTTLLAIGLLLVGIVAYRFLPVASMPNVELPTIRVSASRPGADPAIMAATVAAPLERHLGAIAGVTEITSVSSLGQTSITVQFDLARKIDGAARDVQAAINASLTDLPSDLPSLPTFRKFNPAASPVLILALTSKTMPPSAIYDAADTVVAQRIAQVSGVADVTVSGAEQPAIRVRVNPGAVASAGISLEQVRTAIAAANAQSPLGVLDGSDLAETIGINDQLRRVPDYRDVMVKSSNGTMVRLSDIATVEQSTRNTRSAAWFNRQPSVLLIITKQGDANVIETVDNIKALIPEIKRWIPADIDISILSDRTGTIRASVHDMQLTLVGTIALVMLVVFLFLRRTAPTIAAGVTVPLSLAGTCALMWCVGFSIDNLSLMALAVSVGFVVDDAIVMIENVFRNMEKGHSPLRATIEGARQIGFTVISISVSLVAAFIPLLFMGGIVGRAFREFSVTLVFAIVISTIVSLTVTPMICAHYIRSVPSRTETRFDRIGRMGDLAPAARLCGEPHRAAGAPRADAGGDDGDHRAHRRSLHQDAEGLLPAGRQRADLHLDARLARHLVPRDGRDAAQGARHHAGRSGGRGRRLLGRRLGVERVGQPGPPVRQPQAARRTRQRRDPARDRPAAPEIPAHPRRRGVDVPRAGRARRRALRAARSISSRCGAPISMSC